MTRHQLEKFILYLQKENWLVFGPTENTIGHNSPQPPLNLRGGGNSPQPQQHQETVSINQIEKPEDLILDDRLPLFPWKHFFVPEKETLFEYKNGKLASPSQAKTDKVALIGVNILDLKAVNLYDQVFERDPYYQRRRRNTLIVGHSIVPQIEDPSIYSGQDNLFETKYEEDILEHLPFDIFLAQTGDKRLAISHKLFTGSLKGQRILEHFGYKNYEHIQFSGPVKESKPDERMERLRDKLKNHHSQQIWDELGKRCIECGKCTITCPTCFCFRVSDAPELKENTGARIRCWDSCYYAEFSEVNPSTSSGHKFLSNTASRIHFWYFHKFARIPDEFNFMGCVGCRRCAKVCPVGIDIKDVLKNIEAS